MYLALSREDAEKILKHPDIYSFVGDDGSLPVDDYHIHPEVSALVVYDPEPIACAIFYPHNVCTFEIHTCTLPHGRARSYIYGRAMLAWIWENTGIQKLVATIPANNRQTLLYTLRIGFNTEGISTNSFLHNGELINQTYIGIERCQQ